MRDGGTCPLCVSGAITDQDKTRSGEREGGGVEMWMFILACVFYSILIAIQIDQGKQIAKIHHQLFFIRRKLDNDVSDFIPENSNGSSNTPPDESE